MENVNFEKESNVEIDDHIKHETRVASSSRSHRKRRIGNYWALFTLFAFLIGLGGGYFLGDYKHAREHQSTPDPVSLAQQVNPSDGYALPASFGDIGPQLLAAGAIDYDKFVAVYARSGQQLTGEQLAILNEGSDAQIVIDRDNAYFLLNFFWVFGLANENPILTEGPMMKNGPEQVTNFASTGGWTIASRPVIKIYASIPMVTLTEEQQALLENVATQVYRPCCNNPTHFPDCNHGMAMLGMLELMAAEGATEEQLFEAAKYVNAFWYSQQTIELAAFFKATQNTDFAQVDSQQLVSANFSSSTGFQNIHQWLVSNGKLQQVPGGGSSCGV
jgi:hypothetical protein